MAKNKRKTKKRKSKPKKQLSKTEKPIIEEIKPNEQGLGLYKKLTSIKSLISFGTFSFFLGLWISFYPENLQIGFKIVGNKEPFGNIISIKNINKYRAFKVKVMYKIRADFTDEGGSTYNNSYFEGVEKYIWIEPNKSKDIDPKHLKTKHPIKDILKSEMQIITSYETPFIYPYLENDTIFITGRLNSNGETIYLYK